MKMTWGKRSHVPRNVEELCTKAKEVANKKLGVEKMNGPLNVDEHLSLDIFLEKIFWRDKTILQKN